MVGIKLSSRIGKKGQIVIPKAIRDQFGIHPNTEIYFFVEDNKVIIASKTSQNVVQEFFNAIKKKKKMPRKIDWDKEYYSQFD